MNLKIVFSDFRNTPIQFLIPKVWGQFVKRKKLKTIRKEDERKSDNSSFKIESWNQIFSLKELILNDKELEDLTILSINYKQHYFEILGSGWLPWKYDYRAKGFMGSSFPNKIKIENFDDKGSWISNVVSETNRDYSSKIWKEIIHLDPKYIPIDWSRDMKSGYRFESKTHFSLIKKVPGLKGVDIKVPWEMGRLQHLPLMTLCGIRSNNNEILDEVKCQLLDFVMSNPIRMGVQWSSTMDSAIRLFNMIMVLDSLIQHDQNILDSNFFCVMSNSVKQHLEFCWNFKEDKDGLSNNHYLANLLGVVSASYVLYDSNQSKRLENSCNLLLFELEKQFLNDGGNFESSIPYHFFASEIGVLSLSILQRIMVSKSINVSIDKALFEKVELKLWKAFQLCECTIHDDVIPQIGDNDSARMFFWKRSFDILSHSEYNEKYVGQSIQNVNKVIDFNYLNYNNTLDFLNGYFNSSSSLSLHSSFVQSIIDNRKPKSFNRINTHFQLGKKDFKLAYTKSSFFKLTRGIKSNLNAKSFEEFGIYIFKSDRLFLTVNATNRHVRQYWPHSHNDKLSIELWFDQTAIVRDPGSFTYTGDWELRNKYRSAQAHCSIIVSSKKEQNTWINGIEGVFRMVPKCKVDTLSFGEDHIVLRAKYSGVVHVREIYIEQDGIRMIDHCNKEFSVNQFPNIKFSNGYGKMLVY